MFDQSELVQNAVHIEDLEFKDVLKEMDGESIAYVLGFVGGLVLLLVAIIMYLHFGLAD